MTWTKTGVEFPDDCANVGLSDAAYRTHHEAISWLFKVERTDCLIPKRLVRRVLGSDHAEEAVSILVALHWWIDRGDTYEISEHSDDVRSGIVAQQKKRERDKNAQAAARDRAAKEKVQGTSSQLEPGADPSADVSADASKQTTKHLRTENQTDCSACGEPAGFCVCSDRRRSA